MTSALFIGHTDKTPLLEGALINYVALKSPVNLSQSPVHLSVPSPPITVPSPPIPVTSPPIPVPSPLIPVPSPVIPVPSPHISELYQHYLCLSPPPTQMKNQCGPSPYLPQVWPQAHVHCSCVLLLTQLCHNKFLQFILTCCSQVGHLILKRGRESREE